MLIDPVTFTRINGHLAVWAIIQSVPAYLFGWVDLVRYISFLSIVAAIWAPLTAWQAGRAQKEARATGTVYTVTEVRNLVRRKSARPRVTGAGARRLRSRSHP